MTDSNARAWQRLTPAEQDALTAAGYIRTWKTGDIIAIQGAPPGGVLVILEGWVKISVTNDRGESAPVAVRGRGDIIGELSPISGMPRTATMQAMGNSRTLVVPRDRLLNVLSHSSHVAQELLRVAAIRLQQSDRLRLETGGPDFPARFATILLELCSQYAPDTPGDARIDLPFGQEELASFARVSRSTLIRGLEELRKRGIIQTARRRTTIVQLSALRAAATGEVAGR